MARRTTFVCALFALLLAACGASPPEQASEGEGWEYLGFHRSGYRAPRQAQIFASVEVLETRSAIVVDQPNLDDFVLLLVNDGADGCGPPVYDELTATETGLYLTQAQDESGQSCIDIGIPGSTVFAVETSLLPEHDGLITVDRDWAAAPAQVSVIVLR